LSSYQCELGQEDLIGSILKLGKIKMADIYGTQALTRKWDWRK